MRDQPPLERSDVLGAMYTMYQRGKIQEESMVYEHKKHDGSLPLIGVNTFLPKDHGREIATEIEQIRSTEEEKGAQIANVRRYGEVRNALVADSSRRCKKQFINWQGINDGYG